MSYLMCFQLILITSSFIVPDLLFAQEGQGVPLTKQGTESGLQGQEDSFKQNTTEKNTFDLEDYIRIFSGNLAVGLFTMIIICYVIQAYFTYVLASKPVHIKGSGNRNPSNNNQPCSVFEALKHLDSGYMDIWVFFALAIILPSFLSAMGNVIPILNPKAELLNFLLKDHFLRSYILYLSS